MTDLIANTVIVILGWIANHWLLILGAWIVASVLAAPVVGRTLAHLDQED